MEIKNNKLFIGELPAQEIADRFGTPLYVYDGKIIQQRYRELNDCLTHRPLRIYYACKANSNQAILQLLREEGAFLDAVSPGEILAGLSAGYDPQHILFTGNNVTDEEMQLAIEKKVLVNIDSLSQLQRYGKLNPQSDVSIRINPDVGGGHHSHVITGGPESKFGIYYDRIKDIKKISEEFKLTIVGVHQHIGTGILDTDKFLLAMKVLLKVAGKFADLEFIDFGGGLGIPYKPGQERLPMAEFGLQVSKLFQDFCRTYGKNLTMAIEPGRYIVAESGVLLCRVNTIKRNTNHIFVGVNTGFNHLIRPTMYGAYHEIIKTAEVKGKHTEKIAICGNICESGDVFTRDEHGIVDRELPQIKEGDVLAILDTGAYGYAMASTYNLRPRPAEVMVKNTKASMVRKADTVAELLSNFQR